MLDQLNQLKQMVNDANETNKQLECDKKLIKQEHCQEIKELKATIEEFKLHNLELVNKMAN